MLKPYISSQLICYLGEPHPDITSHICSLFENEVHSETLITELTSLLGVDDAVKTVAEIWTMLLKAAH